MMNIVKIYDHTTEKAYIRRIAEIETLQAEIDALEKRIKALNARSWNLLDQWFSRNRVCKIEWVQDHDGKSRIETTDSTDDIEKSIRNWVSYHTDRMGGSLELLDDKIIFVGSGSVRAIHEETE